MNKVQLKLYVAGRSPNSMAAIRNLEHFCGELPPGSFDMEVLDVLAQPAVALHAAVMVTPTLEVVPARGSPRRIVGTLKDTAQLQMLLSALS